MSQIIPLFANPGQTVSLIVQTLDGYTDGYGDRAEPSSVPKVMSILFPDRTLAAGFPEDMVKLSTGLYIYDLIIPEGPTSIGTFTASVLHKEGDSNVFWNTFIINVARPFGNSSASPI